MNDDMLADALEPLLAEQCTPATVRAIEHGDRAAAYALWQTIETSGFCDALVSEAQGGAGLGLRDVYGLVTCCGRHALPLPLPQTMLVRGLLTAAGIAVPAGPIAVAAHAAGATLRVADGAVARHALVADGASLALIDLAAAGGEPVGEGSLDAVIAWPPPVVARFDAVTDLRAQQALLLAASMAGTMQRLLDMTLQYANDRSQFGRSIGKFQAVQHQLAEMAEQTQAARMAARMGFEASGITATVLACALAKATNSTAAVQVAAIAHAVHGAVGITEEFDLQLHTRRLQAARVEAGSESYWHARIGSALVDAGHNDVVRFARTAFMQE